jgi:hypothetical protein
MNFANSTCEVISSVAGVISVLFVLFQIISNAIRKPRTNPGLQPVSVVIVSITNFGVTISQQRRRGCHRSLHQETFMM